jgi:hypothetical protein
MSNKNSECFGGFVCVPNEAEEEAEAETTEAPAKFRRKRSKMSKLRASMWHSEEPEPTEEPEDEREVRPRGS